MAFFFSSAGRLARLAAAANPSLHRLLGRPPPPPVPSPSSHLYLPFLAAGAAAAAASLDLSGSSFCDAGAQDHRGRENNELLVEGDCKRVPKELINELQAICGNNMSLDYDDRYFHGKPQNSFHKALNIPDVIVYPKSQDDIIRIVLACNAFKMRLCFHLSGVI